MQFLKQIMNNDYQIIGSGEKAIFFVHYFGGDRDSWQWLANQLKDEYTCILVNLPGFGGNVPLSTKSIPEFSKWIKELVIKLHLKDYVLCGHSMGAKLVLYAATLLTTNKPSQILLIAPSPPTIEKMEEQEKERMLKHPDRDVAIETVKKVTVQKLKQERFDHAVQSQLIIDQKTWKWWINSGMNNSIAAKVKNLTIPVHVICSQDDPVIPLDDIHNEVIPYLTNSQLTILIDAGHLIPMEIPETLAQIIKENV